MKTYLTIIAALFLFCPFFYGQAVPEHISNRPLYDFLDELASDHVITLSSAVKPYSRTFIAEKLEEAYSKKEKLTQRQLHEVEMYLTDFAPELQNGIKSRLALIKRDSTFIWSILPPVMNYRDSLFRFSLKPVYGIHYYTNENGNIRHTWGGLSAHSYIGDNWSVWASLRDNQQKGGRLARPSYLSQSQGGAYKGLTGGGKGGEFSEMRAGISWSWSWGSLSFEKDHVMMGDNYHGASILSGRTPSYPMVKLHMNPAPWLNFNYHHGWLVSKEVDSIRSYTPYDGAPERIIYTPKYISVNMFTFTPFERLDFSIGNSIIYSDMDVYPGYLIPFSFFKSIVHTQSQGTGHNHNSAMFINVSSRNIKHLHLYGTWFVDEFSVTRIGDSERTNFTGTKAGFRLSNWPVKDVALTAEYTFTYPKTYQHRTPSTTFETNRFNLGHYLTDNSRELYFSLDAKLLKKLNLSVSYLLAEKGNVTPYLYGEGPVDRDPFMKDVVWRNNTLSFSSRYIFYNNISLFAEFHQKNIRGYDVDGLTAQEYLDMFTPEIFHGWNNTFTFGFQMGF